ncbi:UDP-Glycosyltransferase/glycogen phosphorylase [Eremomyces bilateralis CBS 781.70]|uniref:UDP-Glycosyltransferase/glycogen phosphorylase n=1 Tax=Eremomyces bilateralis CBS 781.70 TaxID=1392243 RepID=A0A6G1G7H9_9PEZI|nr:UDP-Glycosyltransferase/glycogen phosphorylase [Eremomyces bilateralis CBS 781.70]KAF1813799.1 UDP-Glycosyltransferase/glycogen phosphorylase [Eremomyces bilateralis CBS 781.70]
MPEPSSDSAAIQESTPEPPHPSTSATTTTSHANGATTNGSKLVRSSSDPPYASTSHNPPVRASTDPNPPRPPLRKSRTSRPAALQHSQRRTWNRRARPVGLSGAVAYQLRKDEGSSSESESDEDADIYGLDGEGINGPDEEAQKGAGKRSGPDWMGPFSHFHIGNEHFRSKGRVSHRDGRLHISVNEFANSGYLAKALGGGIKRHLRMVPGTETEADQKKMEEEEKTTQIEKKVEVKKWWKDPQTRPRLNIVIIVIGSRGDIQPFIKIGKVLKDEYGHRVRLATHPAFKNFVEKDSGLEFFSVGGDPSELMAFMVKNPGLIPSIETVKKGEVGRRRKAMHEMFKGMWRACVNTTDDENDLENLKMLGTKFPFVADVMIANPPSMVHIDIAERLGIHCHLIFTFPYSPTTAFPHPLANIKRSNIELGYANFVSYPLVEMMTWQGLGDLVNKFREETLGLEPLSTLWAPGREWRLSVPHTYMWSPSLVPKPRDWGDEITVSGYVFLELASSFTPPEDLAKFLEAREPPVYIGFGSIVVDDPARFTKLIFEAVKIAGVRALVSKGWGGLGGGGKDKSGGGESSSNSPSSNSAQNEDEDTVEGIKIPDNILLLGNTPHDWLFPRCSAVIHHGGAGTTAIGLKCKKPTAIVPFFGDQPFWGEMLAKSGAGAKECIPYKQLTAEKLAGAIKECLTDEAQQKAEEIGKGIEAEGDGAKNAVEELFKRIPMGLVESTELGEKSMRCSILKDHVAVWEPKRKHHGAGYRVSLSALAAEVLVRQKKLQWKNLRLVRHQEWNDFEGPGEPITGISAAGLYSIKEIVTGVGRVPVDVMKDIEDRIVHYNKKRRLKKAAHQRVKQLCTAEANGSAGKPSRRPMLLRKVTGLSTLSADPSENILEEVARQTGLGIKRTAKAIAKMPMLLLLALAYGFHNAPRLYGDDTVRRPVRITGMRSGLRAGRNELMYGVYDGVTGLVRLPVRGVKEDGIVGGLVGFGMGFGGFLLKDIAALVGPPAYAMKGVEKQYERWRGRGPEGWVRRTRIAEGGLQARETQAGMGINGVDEEERNARGWREWEEVQARVLDGWDVLFEAMELEKKEEEGEGLREKARRKRVDLTGEERTEIDVPMAERELHERARSLERVRMGRRDEGNPEGKQQKQQEPQPSLKKQSTIERFRNETARTIERKMKSFGAGRDTKIGRD